MIITLNQLTANKDAVIGVIPDKPIVPPITITITGASTIDIDKGKTLQLGIAYTPDNTSDSEKGITWSVSDSTKAFIDKTGVLTIKDGVRSGSVIVHAVVTKYPSVSADFNITITDSRTLEASIKTLTDAITKPLTEDQKFMIQDFVHSLKDNGIWDSLDSLIMPIVSCIEGNDDVNVIKQAFINVKKSVDGNNVIYLNVPQWNGRQYYACSDKGINSLEKIQGINTLVRLHSDETISTGNSHQLAYFSVVDEGFNVLNGNYTDNDKKINGANRFFNVADRQIAMGPLIPNEILPASYFFLNRNGKKSFVGGCNINGNTANILLSEENRDVTLPDNVYPNTFATYVGGTKDCIVSIISVGSKMEKDVFFKYASIVKSFVENF